MRKGRPKTEEQKQQARAQQQRHWTRCEKWGELLEVSKMKINEHWSCCIKEANGDFDGEGQPKIDTLVTVRRAFADCLLKHAKREAKSVAWRQRRLEDECRSTRRSSNQPAGDEAPDLDQRIKIMLWAIKTVGGVENAKDALERAIRSLED